MDPVDLSAWASRHLDDPDLREVARAVTLLLGVYVEQGVVIELVEKLLETPPTGPEFWRAYDQLAAYLHSRSGGRLAGQFPRP